MSDTLLEIGNLKTYYFAHGSVIKAVDDVSLGIYKREMVGLVGESGSGKSTLGLSIIKLVPPPGKIVDGKIIIGGEDLLKLRDKELKRIRGRKIGMIFQDPLTCLDPLRRVGDQIIESIMSHIKVNKEAAREMALKVFERVGISPERIDDYPHQLSGGMRQRAMIAMAVVLNPELLIVDEPTTALDVVVQSRIMDLLEDLKNERKMSILLITHDLALVIERCDRVVIMYAGRVCEIGSVKEVSNEPLHPYTKLLIESIPNIEGTQMELKPIPGTPPDMRNPPPGCRFWPRCPYVLDKCKSVEPSILEIDNRVVFCHLYGG